MSYLPIKDYEGLYEINEQGIIRSINRNILGNDGAIYPKKGIIIGVHKNKQNTYYQVNLWKNNIGTSFYVHRLLAQHFIPNPYNKPEVNHIDGNRHNNALTNLEWVTSKENSQHAINTGAIVYTCRLTKEQFTVCLQNIIEGESYFSLSKRVPYQVPFLSVKLRKIAKELGLENELNESLQQQRIERAKRNGIKNRKEDRAY